jgi:uncharacterized protein (DUF427 family)
MAQHPPEDVYMGRRHLEDVYMGPLPLIVPSPDQRFRWEPSPRRIRAVLGGVTIAQSDRVMLLLEAGRLPVYYFPWADVRAEALERTAHSTTSDLKGPATYWTVRAGDRVAEDAAWSYETPPPGGPGVAGYVAFYWDQMDAWFDEDERAVAHARDPYKLVDVRQSSRHVRVELAGVTLAETRRPKLLFETPLPVRYYFPPEDVHMELLVPSATTSQCAYKGAASHWSAKLGDQVIEDVAWCYQQPLHLAAQVSGFVAFYQERVDATVVDGETVDRPRTPWAR